MAIPLIVGGLALLASGAGVKKSWEAKENFSKANRLMEDAQAEFRYASEQLEHERQTVSGQLADLGRLRLRLRSKSLERMSTLMNQVHGAELGAIQVEGHDIQVEAVDVKKVTVSAYEATDFLAHGIQGASTSVLVGLGIGQAVTLAGTASTGETISGLSGGAATNATLAWLGSDSLTLGGFNIASGTTLLGGALASPVIAVMGYVAANKSEKALTKAWAHSAELEKAAEQMKTGGAVLQAIGKRTGEVQSVIRRLDKRFQNAASRLDASLQALIALEEGHYFDIGMPTPEGLSTRKISYQSFDATERSEYDSMVLLGSALFNALKVTILDTDGELTPDSQKLIRQSQQLLEIT